MRMDAMIFDATFHLFDRSGKLLRVRRTPGIPPASTSFHPSPFFSKKKGEGPLFNLPYSSIAALSCPTANHLTAAWSR